MSETHEWFIRCDLGNVSFPIVSQIGNEEIVIFNSGGRLIAMQRWCPHQKADLAMGKLIGDAVKCPKHGFIFRLRDGRGLNCPGINAKVFDVLIEEGGLRVKAK